MNLVEKIEKQVYNDNKSNPYYSFRVDDIIGNMGDVVFSPQMQPVDLPDSETAYMLSITESDLAG